MMTKEILEFIKNLIVTRGLNAYINRSEIVKYFTYQLGPECQKAHSSIRTITDKLLKNFCEQSYIKRVNRGKYLIINNNVLNFKLLWS
jgi:hypothetical protein